MGCGGRSIVLHKQYENTNQPQHLATDVRREPLRETHLNPNQRETEMMVKCRKWITSPRTHSSQGESQLYIFEDNEAVIKMILKGRSPTMRHVSITHRVAIDWLFDRINLDSKIQIKYVDTKNQLADVITKASFTR